jgi:hypothetical protein
LPIDWIIWNVINKLGVAQFIGGTKINFDLLGVEPEGTLELKTFLI